MKTQYCRKWLVRSLLFIILCLFSANIFADDTTPPSDPVVTHPWNNILEKGAVVFKWKAIDDVEVAGYSYLLNDTPDTVVDDISEGVAAQKRYVLSAGNYYFHVAAVDTSGNWSNTTHFPLRILPGSILVDTFDDGEPPNELGGAIEVHTEEGGTCTISHTETTFIGESGYSLRIDYNVPEALSKVHLITYLQDYDLSACQSLSFWVKGETGNEIFKVKVEHNQDGNYVPLAGYYLPGGAKTSWRRVDIPLKEFWGVTDWTKIRALHFYFAGRFMRGSGTIYLDNIRFLSDEIFIDDFESGRALDAFPYGFYADDNASITVAYDTVAPHNETGTSLAITYSDVTDKVHCRWKRDIPAIDVSALNMLGFYVKGADGAEYFDILLNDGEEIVSTDIREYLTVTAEWQYVQIPLADFVNKGLNPANVTNIEILFGWDEIETAPYSGTIYVDDIHFTNGLYKPPSTGPVRLDGNRLFVNGKPFLIKGVCYQPTPIGYYPYDPEDGSPWLNVYEDTTYNRMMWQRDLEYLRRMGCNTIRTWGAISSRAFLDACYNDGDHPIYVIMGYWIDHNLNLTLPEDRLFTLSQFKGYVNAYKDHPAVLMWAVGNEDNYWYPYSKGDIYSLVNAMARVAYEEEGPEYHPVVFPNGEIENIGIDYVIHDTENVDRLRASDTSMNYLDIWGTNVYRGSTFGDLFLNIRRPILDI